MDLTTLRVVGQLTLKMLDACEEYMCRKDSGIDVPSIATEAGIQMSYTLK